jgi:hypothetical protein
MAHRRTIPKAGITDLIGDLRTTGWFLNLWQRLCSTCHLHVRSPDFGGTLESGYGAAKRFLDELSFSGPGIYGHFHTHAGT